MAGKANNNTWLILVLIVVAGIFIVMAFTKEKAKTPSVQAETASVAAVASVPLSDVQTIKPAHVVPASEVAKPKAMPAVVIPPQDVLAREILAVQVYSFKEKARAEAALSALKNKGYSAYIMVSDLGARGTWYRVRVGTFANEAEAKKALERITKDFKSGIIVNE